jgi:hypothetical protein
LAAADPLTAGERGDPAPIKAVGILVVDVLDTRRSDFEACPAQAHWAIPPSGTLYLLKC